MKKILYIFNTALGGSLGWYLGSKIGGIMTAYFCGVFGTAVGIYFTQKITRHMP